jgi:hypothetical protein
MMKKTIIIPFVLLMFTIGCPKLFTSTLRIQDTFIIAVNEFDQNEPAAPGELRIFTSKLDRLSRWEEIDKTNIAMPFGDTGASYLPRPLTRPAVWSAIDSDYPIKFAVFYWDMFPPQQGNTDRGDHSRLIATTFSDDFGWTTSMPIAGINPFRFANIHRKGFSPAVAKIGNEFVVAWGEDLHTLSQHYRIWTMKVRFIREDSGNNINRYQLQKVSQNITDTGLTSSSPVTLIAHEGNYVLGFRQTNADFVISTSNDGENWSTPSPTDIPNLIVDPTNNHRRIRPLQDVWGLSWSYRVDGAIDLTTVGETFVGSSQSQNQLLRFRAGTNLSGYTLVEQVTGIDPGSWGFSVAGPESEGVGAYKDRNSQIRIRVGSSNIILPAASPGMVRTAPSIAFGHSIP